MSDIQPNIKPAFLDWSYRADCRCERDFGLDRTIFLDLGGGLIRTPEEIAKQMIDMLPIEVWNRNTTFLDPCCKSGVFLKYISDRLLVCPDLVAAFPNPRERVQYIQLKQLHGIAWTNETYWQCRKQVNRSIRDDEPNSIRLVENLNDIMKTKDNGELFHKILKESFGRMNFDVVIGNPPYNKDIYLDFVTKGHQVANKYSVWITPAKWQAKGGQKNEDFRQNIVPYMSKIVYYKEARDIFDIALSGGISYYLLDKCIHDIKIVNNKEKKLFGSYIDLTDIEIGILNKISSNTMLLNSKSVMHPYRGYFLERGNVPILDVVMKYGDDSSNIYAATHKGNNIEKYYIRKSACKHQDQLHLYKLDISQRTFEHGAYTSLLREPYEIGHNGNSCTVCIGSLDECKSADSYFGSKLIFWLCKRFFGQQTLTEDSFKFVPDPGAFDHIFTDEELYKKYNLTQEEINIIESAIKERK